MLRMLIADDHAIVRRGLKDILLEAFPSAEITRSWRCRRLIQKIIKEQYDVVITDISMPGRSGLEAYSKLKRTMQNCLYWY